MEKALEWLDLRDSGGGEAVDGALRSQLSMSECSWRASHACPVVHASSPVQSEPETLHSCPRFPFGGVGGKGECSMSSTVTASIQESVQDMAVGKIKSNAKTDCAIFKQAMDQRTRMVLFEMLDHQIFIDTDGCISTGKDVLYHLQSAILATLSFSTI